MLRLVGLQQRSPHSADDKEKDAGDAPRARKTGSTEACQTRNSLVLPVLCLVILLQLWQITLQSSNERLLRELRGTQVSPVDVPGGSGKERVLEEEGALPVPASAPALAASGGTQSCNCSCAGPPKYTAPVFDLCEVAIVGGRKRDGYGSWPVCVNQVPRPGAIVYSFGIGLDVSFDAAMIRRGAQVFGFDPTIKPEILPGLFGPSSKELMPNFKFSQIGLGTSNGVATFLKSTQPGIQSMTALGVAQSANPAFTYKNVGFQAAVLSLPSIMAMLGHDHVDLLKVDVEGIEFKICETPGFLQALSRVGQVIYEFHERLIKNPGTKKVQCIERLRNQGFTLVNKTETEEYVFARMATDGHVVLLPRGSSGSAGGPVI